MARFVCELLSERHDLSAFASGNSGLDEWLRVAARNSDGRHLTRTYVWHGGDDVVVAYYSVMPFLIERADLTRGQGRGLTDSIPGFLLARLALDASLHGQRLGSHLLASALLRLSEASRDVGGRFVIVDAVDEGAGSFYRHHGFTSIGRDPDRLILTVKAIQVWLDRDAAQPPD